MRVAGLSWVFLSASVLGCGVGGGAPDAARLDAPLAPTTCTDPLHTGLVAMQTGVSADAFDCEILASAAAHGEPDPMIFKAIVYVESRFDRLSVACTNHPCGIPSGWVPEESGCFGLMQIVPACAGAITMQTLLPNGHPDLEMDPSAADWAGSVFNPATNVEVGVAGIADNRRQVMEAFPGCTEEQYTLMAIGNYNSYGSTESCTVYNTDYVNIVLAAYDTYVAASGYAAHAYPR